MKIGCHLELGLVEHGDPLASDDVLEAFAEGVGRALDLHVQPKVGHPVDVLQPVAVSHRPLPRPRQQLNLRGSMTSTSQQDKALNIETKEKKYLSNAGSQRASVGEEGLSREKHHATAIQEPFDQNTNVTQGL